MQAIIAEEDASMEELDDHNLQMEETAQGLLRTPSLKESYHSDTDFMTDDRSSAASGLDVADRLTYLEQRMQMQEDEIQLLKLALADVLKRLNISEEHQAAAAAGRRMPGAKARPVSLALPPRTSMATSSSTSLKKSSTVPSSATARNYSPAPPPLSGVKSPPGGAKDSPCKITKPRPASAASVCKKVPEESNKSSEPAVSVGTRRVTHCKGRLCLLEQKDFGLEENAIVNRTVCELFFLFFIFLVTSYHNCVHHHPISCVHFCFSSSPFSLFRRLQCPFFPPCPFSASPRHISPLHLVTMQIYLSPLARKTGSSEEAKSASAVPAYRGPVAGPGPPPTKRGGQPQKKKSTPSFTLSLQKTVTGQSSAQETSSYISPVKSPSQYFQICY
ncbi:uncharacterized protein LOC102227022 isoform X2 [Xiphophorus maculatus]|uniref:uncharacterized protein LOC102227022 isoform X2 n=1 Tax=Xiphophorus maculatus TaxID=8083 RepID=UPI000C6D10DF|nr:uncharacterized protein LOC102227022 isoform X2 [Xiphophorus maculatus]